VIQLVQTFVPVYTVIATILAAWLTTGRRRTVALAVIPLAGAVLSWAVLPVTGADGNMLAVLLVLLLTVALPLYYLALLIAGLVAVRRSTG